MLTGRKYWLLFPPHTIPPGVHVSADESEVTSPLSIAEWLLEFHAEARRTEGGMEGVCGEGEVLHVPAGWWHLVVNLEESVALTGNFVGEGGLVGTLLFLRDRRGQVSGYDEDAEAMGGRGAGEGVHEGGSLYEVFVEKLREARLEILQDALDRIEQLDEAKKQKQWANIAGKDKDDEDGGFSFGFGDDADEDE